MERKKILIISDLFYPTTEIGAIRPTKIAKFLKKNGYQVDIFTRYNCDDIDLKIYCDNIYTFESKKINISVKKIKKKNKFQSLKNTYRMFLLIKRSRIMFKNFKILSFDLMRKNKYDVVLSTFGPLSSLWCGLYYKKKYPDIKWICDFRDPIVLESTPKIFFLYFKWLERVSCKKADSITVVSQGYLERICPKKYRYKAFMIPNGYDDDDQIYKKVDNIDRSTIRFLYVGTLYEGKRKLIPIFKVIRELIDEKIIDENKIEFCYAGNDAAFFLQQARLYKLEDRVKNYNNISRIDCLKLQFNSDFLLLSTWNNKKEFGVFPGKLLEYMLINKPIISIVDGNLPNSEVSSVIEAGNLGISYEYARKGIDYKKLKKYIKKQYLLVVSDKSIDFKPNKSLIENYSYCNIIKQLEEVIN